MTEETRELHQQVVLSRLHYSSRHRGYNSHSKADQLVLPIRFPPLFMVIFQVTWDRWAESRTLMPEVCWKLRTYSHLGLNSYCVPGLEEALICHNWTPFLCTSSLLLFRVFCWLILLSMSVLLADPSDSRTLKLPQGSSTGTKAGMPTQSPSVDSKSTAAGGSELGQSCMQLDR